MRRERGFTMIELAVVVAIIAVLAGLGFMVARSGRANASMASATYELAIRLTGQRAEALADGVDRMVVLVDADDASRCGTFDSASCLRYFVLRGPVDPWALDGFDPASPVAHAAEVLEQRSMPSGVRLHVAAEGAHPASPFQNVTLLDPALRGTCAGGRHCYAVRFTGDGDVQPVYPGLASPAKAGLGLVLAGAATGGAAGEAKGIVVGFPSGIVRTFPYFGGAR